MKNINLKENKLMIFLFVMILTILTVLLIFFIGSISNNTNSYKNSVKEDLKLLYSDYDKNIVRSDVTRIEYNNIKIKYHDLKDKELIDKINNIDNYLKEKEIASAWTKLNIKYISQNENKVLNGCEAACLLMSLQYKGYLKNMNLYNYSDKMPKSDDPNKGFYLDIFKKEPKDKSHWIAPKPLRDYGITSSNYYNIFDGTGYSLDDLDNEVKNGNPVIIYLTSQFEEPKDYYKGVPKNLHVQLLAGYNEITKEQFIIDPWKYKKKSSYWIRPKKEIEKIYNELGKRAVIVR